MIGHTRTWCDGKHLLCLTWFSTRLSTEQLWMNGNVVVAVVVSFVIVNIIFFSPFHSLFRFYIIFFFFTSFWITFHYAHKFNCFVCIEHSLTFFFLLLSFYFTIIWNLSEHVDASSAQNYTLNWSFYWN